ncbi:MAG: nucleotidyl transferase AbiEii/AbiGii toxin family protein [Bacteroidia bacterium]|nr:nucleotidyl transferase AbiEii/AbiGii toxin family protein [Bacteroidia bacterium]
MRAVTPAIIKAIIELQTLPTVSKFNLGGGTNLALQFNHRVSDDIDFFCNEIIGKEGFNNIEKEVKNCFGNKAKSFDDPCDINDQYCFLRFFLDLEDGTTIKIELLQNMKNLFDLEVKQGISLLSNKDIGLFKLISTSNRSTKKDIYDLDFITDKISLIDLYEDLKVKTLKFNKEEHKTIFDLSKNNTPIDNPELLLKFDDNSDYSKFPSHSKNTIQIIEGRKSWIEAKLSWQSKVRRLYNYLGKDFPGPKGTKIK